MLFLRDVSTETTGEGNDKSSAAPVAESTAVSSGGDDDAGEYTSLKETAPAKQGGGDGSDQPLLKSTDSEGSTSGSESAAGALYARIARLSKQSKEDEDSSTVEIKGNGKPPSPERTKPRPPDPSTKPKVSWIHGTAAGTNQSDKGKGETPPVEKKRSSSEKSGKTKDRKSQESKTTEAGDSPSKSKPQKGRTVEEHREHINGVVQNALKKISIFPSGEKKAAAAEKKEDTPKEQPPKSPKIMHPHMNSEAATLLAAQLKEKTQSINRNEGLVGVKSNGLSTTPQVQREKPTPPQKAKRSVGTPQQGSTKPLLPTTGSLQKMVGPVTDTAETPEKQPSMNGSKTVEVAVMGDSTPKKTPIKKPPRKKGKEGGNPADAEIKTTPKTAIMPPQVVKNN